MTVTPRTSPLSAIARVASLLTILALCVPAGAAEYDTRWSSIDGGGTSVTLGQGRYVLQGVIGQPDAGTLQIGERTLQGGFLAAMQPRVSFAVAESVFLNRRGRRLFLSFCLLP